MNDVCQKLNNSLLLSIFLVIEGIFRVSGSDVNLNHWMMTCAHDSIHLDDIEQYITRTHCLIIGFHASPVVLLMSIFENFRIHFFNLICVTLIQRKSMDIALVNTNGKFVLVMVKIVGSLPADGNPDIGVIHLKFNNATDSSSRSSLLVSFPYFP